MKLNKTEKKLLHIERACGDLRRGMAVLIRSEDGTGIYAVSPDSPLYRHSPSLPLANYRAIQPNTKAGSPYNFEEQNSGDDESAAKNQKLIISRTRANYLFPDREITTAIAINAEKLSHDEIAAICASYPPAIDLKNAEYAPARKLEEAALKLAKISELLPSVVVFSPLSLRERDGERASINNLEHRPHPSPLPGGEGTSGDFLSVSAKAIESYMENANYSLHEATRAPLALKSAKDAEIIAYRPTIGAPEHYAIIVGKPGAEPLVRVHSSCYTGDLLASLTCDCRDQLQSALEIMGKPLSQSDNEARGGIILYLMQEGRGIGLVNKLRAYNLKHQGMDTVEANRALGFDDDERLFLPAAEMLKKLGIKEIKLLTNNPLKATALEEYGIVVKECVPHIMETNPYNEDYMQTKADKMGHKI